MRLTNLVGESAEHVSAREELRLAEIELMRHRERVADLRRRLPLGPVVDDYAFEEGPADLHADDVPVQTVRLSELFTQPGRDLVVYHFMYGKQQTQPCPMCTMWIDGFNGIAHHVAQNVDFAIVAAADLPTLRAHARDRHWENLRLLSAGAAPSNTTSAARTPRATRTRRCRCSPATATARYTTSTRHTPGCPTPSTNAASTCSARYGTSSTSPAEAGTTGSQN